MTELTVIKRPTTAQLHANSHEMYRLSLHWPFPAGTAYALIEGAVHEVRIVRVAYRYFTTPGPRPRKWFGGKAVDYHVHRVQGKLVLAERGDPELVLFDVLASHWKAWSA